MLSLSGMEAAGLDAPNLAMLDTLRNMPAGCESKSASEQEAAE